MNEINGREYFIDENGRPRWLDNDRLVPPIAWELHQNQGRPVRMRDKTTQVVGKSLQRLDAPKVVDITKQVQGGSWK